MAQCPEKTGRLRIYAAGLFTETNTFAPMPTGERAFEEGMLGHGEACLEDRTHAGLVLRRFHERAVADGHQPIIGLGALAEPAGPTVRAVYERLRDHILDDLTRQGPFDVVLLYLHGAMVADGYPDCEGDLLTRARSVVGERTIIGVELDPHCHLTPAMVGHADLIIPMKEYPHTDYLDIADELYGLSVAAAAGAIRPTTSVFDCHMVGLFPTTAEPMRTIVGRLREAATRPGIVSAGFVHGFPWGDVPEAGAKVIVIGDGDDRAAAAAANELGQLIYQHRDELLPRCLPIDAALDEAQQGRGLAVVADTGDNPGGGAPGDNVTLLGAMLRHGIRDAAFSSIWDPHAARLCADAGVGARLQLRLGGKAGHMSGAPLDLEVTVRAVCENHVQAALGGSSMPMGTAAWVECEGIDIIVNSLRVQTFSPTALTGLGIDPAARRLVAVKSAGHFRALFAPIADRIILCATPGALCMDFAAIPYRHKRDMNFHPRVAAPLS